MKQVAMFVHANGRRVLAAAIVCAVAAGAFGVGVTKSLWPYSAEDPATQSVQNSKRFEAATGRQIDPGVVAVVRSGDVATSGARQRVAEVASMLRGEPAVADVQSFYTTHSTAMVSRDRHSTYVLAYFKPRSDKALKNVAQDIEDRFA